MANTSTSSLCIVLKVVGNGMENDNPGSFLCEDMLNLELETDLTRMFISFESFRMKYLSFVLLLFSLFEDLGAVAVFNEQTGLKAGHIRKRDSQDENAALLLFNTNVSSITIMAIENSDTSFQKSYNGVEIQLDIIANEAYALQVLEFCRSHDVEVMSYKRNA